MQVASRLGEHEFGCLGRVAPAQFGEVGRGLALYGLQQLPSLVEEQDDGDDAESQADGPTKPQPPSRSSEYVRAVQDDSL